MIIMAVDQSEKITVHLNELNLKKRHEDLVAGFASWSESSHVRVRVGNTICPNQEKRNTHNLARCLQAQKLFPF